VDIRCYLNNPTDTPARRTPPPTPSGGQLGPSQLASHGDPRESTLGLGLQVTFFAKALCIFMAKMLHGTKMLNMALKC
jgi:hypothetical protein